MEEVKAYRCVICGYYNSDKNSMQIHIEECQKKFDERKEENEKYRKKLKDRLEEARRLVKESGPIQMLVKHGYHEEAKVLCRYAAKWSLWDCGTSSGMEQVYSVMIEEAQRIVGESPTTNKG